MPAQASTSGRSEQADRIIRRKASARAKPKPYTVHAPAHQPGPFTNAERTAVEKNSRTRSYYRAHQQAMTHRPAYQRAAKEFKRGAGYKKSRDPRAQAKGKLMVLKSLKALEEIHQHGPDTVAAHAYKWYTDKLWDRAKKYYPDPGARPKMKVDYRDDPPGYAWVMPGENVVHYSPTAIRDYMTQRNFKGKPVYSRLKAEQTPLHEFTHTRQSSRTFQMGRPYVEGGATANANDVARALGMTPIEDNSPGYEDYAAMVRRRLGPGWVHFGQYR